MNEVTSKQWLLNLPRKVHCLRYSKTRSHGYAAEIRSRTMIMIGPKTSAHNKQEPGSRILILHDGTTIADKAIVEGIRLARMHSKQLHFLAIVPEVRGLADAAEDKSLETLAFMRLSERTGIEVSGSRIRKPTMSKLRAFIRSQRVCHVVLPSDQTVDPASRMSRLLIEFARRSPVPISLVP